MPRACPEQSVAQLAAQRACSIRKTARHTILFPRRLPPCCRNITGEQPVGVADSEVSSCCDMPRTLSTYKGVVMARHRRWSWSSIALLPCRDGILFHRGIRYVCRQTNWTQATPRRHFLAQDGTRGPAPRAMTTHNRQGSMRAGWYAALVGSLLSALFLMAACAPRMGVRLFRSKINQSTRSSMRRAVAPRCQEPMAAHGVRS
jgi:hypothetical protein